MSLNPAPDTSEPISKERLRLWLKLLKTSRHMEARLRDNFRTEFGVTLPRFDVLAALARFPEGLKMSELSGVLKVSNGNVTGIIERLVEDGMVLREAVPGDKRAARALLTKRGREEFARQAEAHESWIDEMLTGLDDADMEVLTTLLDMISNHQNGGEPS